MSRGPVWFLVNGFLSRWNNSTLLEYIVDVDSGLLAPADCSLVDGVIMFWLHFSQWRLLGDTERERQKVRYTLCDAIYLGSQQTTVAHLGAT